MKIRHLKNQFKCFTLASGLSLYLYPRATGVELSEQDFYFTRKLQRYMKEENGIAIQEYEIPEEIKPKKEVSGYSSKPDLEKSKKSTKFKAKQVFGGSINGSSESNN